jgi:feruloyl-CoA synthase
VSAADSLLLGSRAVDRTVRADGVQILRNRDPLGAYPARATDPLETWAAERPERTFLGERAGDGWRQISYRATLEAVRPLAQALLDRGLGPENGVAILCENGIDHALVGLAAQYAGIPYAPISPSYSLVSKDFAKLRDVLANFGPGLVFVDDGAKYGPAIAAAVSPDVEVVVSRSPGDRPRTTLLAELLDATPGASLETAHAAVGPATVAKILYTSGTTGSPKGVICTNRMLCSNQQMIRQVYRFVETTPPVLLDWLPWNHTFGGNHNVNLVLFNGGTLYVNDGKPTPALAERTLRNLREIAPTIYFDVPKGFELLVGFLRADPELRERFFGSVMMLFYAGAGLARNIWDELQELARATTGHDVFITTSLGSTETGPAALAAPFQGEVGNVGVPIPGVEMKLVPNGGKSELRLRGPNIIEAYWRAPEVTANAFDDEGYYRIGDALRFVDPEDPSRGLVFDGRISEDFKLATGTWVSVGPLRLGVLAHFAPFFSDAVVSGENRNELAILAFPDIAQLRKLASDAPADAPLGRLLESPRLRAELTAALAALAKASSGSATRIERIVLLDSPPSLDAGEITDKGSLNARTIFARRHGAVEAAHAPVPPSHVIALTAVRA